MLIVCFDSELLEIVTVNAADQSGYRGEDAITSSMEDRKRLRKVLISSFSTRLC
jgi:hypothetical protein